MAMIAFYAGLIVGILIGSLLLSLFSFILAEGDANRPGPPQISPQETPSKL
jgi:hypothetical protein